MHRATLRIEIGKEAEDYLDIIGKERKYSRGSLKVKANGGIITIEASAADAKSLLASVNGALKQLRIMSSVDSELSKEK